MQTIPPAPGDWTVEADAALSQFVRASVDLARASALARCVDGLIIGTGQSDFTQGNTTYTWNHAGRVFQLIDSPGIEGHEERFKHLVAQAIAKAHLVFYVNGTNKKPEATTVKRIQSYLGRGTHVCSLVNVKEYADAYEFEDDRKSLEQHAGSSAALRQTEEVLSAVLNPQHLMPGLCIQGLLGFSALALEPVTARSTIHPQRSNDLREHQRKYLSAFGTAEAMRKFSRIDDIAKVLNTKAQTFGEDIIEANKAKVRELLAATVEALAATRKEHRAFMDRVEPELSSAREAVDQALSSYSRMALGARHAQVNARFDQLNIDAQSIVSERFGDEAAISQALEQAFDSAQNLMVRDLESALAPLLLTLEADLNRAVERLTQNLQRVDFEIRMTRGAHSESRPIRLDAGELQTRLGLGGWSKITLTLVTMALVGAELGAALPPWGIFIGAAVGFIVGAAITTLSVFSSRDTRIRRAQRDLLTRMNSKRHLALANATQAHEHFLSEIREIVDAQVGQELEQLRRTLAQPGQMVEQQITAMSRILRQLEAMPHGTVQAVRP